MFSTKKLKWNSWPTSATRPSETAMANRPITSGRIAARIEPNTTISTSRATTRPIDSDLRMSSSARFMKSANRAA
jgi:hypothetical protein